MVALTHAISTLALVGLIWTIQIVHYPLMAMVPPATYPAYQGAHQRRITFLVSPLMVLEGLSAILILFEQSGSPVYRGGLVALLLIWLSTALIQVPCHRLLIDGFDPGLHRRLVRTNWIRTSLWTVRICPAVWPFL